MTEARAQGDTELSTDNTVTRWVKEIELYEAKAEQWETKSKKILRRYKDERNARETKESRYNILWSNIQTLLPALYSKNPKPDFQRRFLDADPVGRVTCQVLERATSFTLDKEDFFLTARQCVTDRLLPGRGTVWVRYVPHFADAEDDQQGEQIGNEGVEIDDDANANQAEDPPIESSDGERIDDVEYEEIDIDYVHWSDFGHTIARTWQEVRAVWRICYLTKAELIARFGEEKGSKVPLDYKPEDLKGQEVTEYQQKARIYEIWDKTTKKAMWLSRGFLGELLDERADMLGLEGFFPCPRPMLPNHANDTVIPVPDYAMYQDQANELDDLTTRAKLLSDALRVAGVYDSSIPGLQQILAGGYDNKLVPVDAWAAFAEKGGLKGGVELLPMDMIATTLLSIYETRDKVKQDLYEITGLADIIRGSTDPDETYGAQKIKSNWASIRLVDMQAEVQRFARDVVVLIAEVLSNQFDIKTLAEISGYPLMTAQEKQIAQMIVQMGGQLPDDMEKPFTEPTWEEVDKLLRDSNMRHFRLDIETDSTLKMDQNQEKSDRTEFLTAIGGFLKSAEGADPVLMPLLGQMLMFAVRAFPVGKQMESCLQETVDALEKKAKQAQDNPPPPNPDQVKANAQIQIADAKNQSDMQQNLAEIQARERAQIADRSAQAQADEADRRAQAMADQFEFRLKAQLEQAKSEREEAAKAQQAQFDGMLKIILAKLDAATKIETAEIAAGAQLDAAEISAANAATSGE
ncbi:hypothetical protein ABH944_004851 [Caballeronia udeis]|uniref:Portal protein n=1 Tax=Caballeronia udeis TaxID=1232866 RepID=A0ABW8MLW7_9BURK